MVLGLLPTSLARCDSVRGPNQRAKCSGTLVPLLEVWWVGRPTRPQNLRQ